MRASICATALMTADDQAAPAGRAPRIEPLTRLATGGMAEIWLAKQYLGAAGLERLVVVKRLLPHLARDPDVVDMFVSEARFVARLVHPNVVQIHELAEDEQGYFLVMEYVEGCSVRELMVAANRTGERLPPAVAVCILEQACRGAHAAHELTDAGGRPLGLVHRDISPHNLMIGPGGDVKLLDFGIAKATEAAGGTHTGSLKGKCSYMSPEQCRAHRLDRRSDVFSLGIVFWELLVGRRLFQREAEYASMEAIVTGDFQLPTEVESDLPIELDVVIAKALATHVDERYQTADALRRAVIAAADKSGLRATRDTLGAKLEELLGPRLEQRERALQQAANASAEDSGLLRDALVPSEPSLQRSISDATGRTGSDDVATVVQRKSARPGPASEVTGSAEALIVPGQDGDTLVEPGLGGDGADGVRAVSPAQQASPLATGAAVPAAAPVPSPAGPVSPARSRWLVLGVGFGLMVVLALLVWGVTRGSSVLSSQQTSDQLPDGSAPDAEAVLSGPPLRFALAPTVEPDVMRRELEPFARWLGRQLGRPVEVVIADSYDQSAELVVSGRAHLGLLPPLLFVQTLAREPRLQPLALRLYHGSRASDGLLFVRDDAKFADAKGLVGRTICLVDRKSTTGFLLPRIWMRNAEIDPDKDVKTRFSGDHLAAMRDLVAGKCDAAAVYSGARDAAQEQGISVGQMRLLTVTGRVPQDVLAATPDLPADLTDKLRKSLIAFEPKRDIGAPRIGPVMGISGFAPIAAHEFDMIREAAEQEGIMPRADAGL